jgi:hypothetical protein
MKEPKLNTDVQHALEKFEMLENIQPSANWNQSLMDRIATKNSSSSLKSSTTKYVVLVLLIVLANVGFALTSMMHRSRQSSPRSKELQLISKELLINPTSLNN